MSKFNKLYEALMSEAGQEAGKLELVKIDLQTAIEAGNEIFNKQNKDLYEEIPNFDKNFLFAQKQAGIGKTLRKDMPVIDGNDVKMFQAKLKDGSIDINEPHSPHSIFSLATHDPFPEGLSGTKAKEWLVNGLKHRDGDKNDDIVKVLNEKVVVGKLKPIQKQIYFDKAMKDTASFGAVGSRNFLENETFFIVSVDNFIVDGHHRYLAAIVIDPKMKVNVVKVDLPIKQLLPLSLAFGDAIGNKRNR